MLFTFSALPVFLLITAILSLSLCVYALCAQKTAFSRHYAGLMFCSTVYALGYGLELASPNLQTMQAMLRIQYLGIPFIPYFWVGLACSYLEPGGLPRHWHWGLLTLSLAIFALTQTNPLHHLYYAQMAYQRLDGLAIAHTQKGSLYWANIAYLDLGTVIGVLLLFRAWRQAMPLYRTQAMLLLAGSLLPWMFHLIYVMGAAPDGVDIAPFGIAATGVTFAIATLRHRILNIQPLARDLVLDGIAEGVVVLDSKLRIIDFNRAATMLLPPLDVSMIGCDYAQLTDDADIASVDQQVIIKNERQLEIRRSELKNRHGHSIGIALLIQDVTEKMAMIEDLRQLAAFDELTGCYNRRHLLELSARALLLAQRYQQPLSLIILDIDDFKKINDLHGHPMGDKLLSHVANTLRYRLRATDILGRYGGDEFIIVLPLTTGPQGFEIAAQLRTSCATECDVQLSLGVAEREPGCVGFDDLLKNADFALYQAKNAGKNRAMLYPLSCSSDKPIY